MPRRKLLQRVFIPFVDVVIAYALKKFFVAVSIRSEKRGVKACLGVVNTFLFFQPQLKKTAVKNLSVVFPDLSQKELIALSEKSFLTLAKNLYWFAKFRILSAEDLRKLIDYREAEPSKKILEESGRGGLFLCPHFSMFELLAQAQVVMNRESYVLIREFGLPKLDKFWTESRERFGLKVFSRKGGFQEMIGHLNDNDDVAVLFDQNVKRAHATFVDLFGIPAATTKSIALAAIRTNCPIFFAVCVENNLEEQRFGRFKIYVRQIPNPNIDPDLADKNLDQKINGFLRKVHQELETVIRLYPSEWFWIHRRWKTRPEGEQENFYSVAS